MPALSSLSPSLCKTPLVVLCLSGTIWLLQSGYLKLLSPLPLTAAPFPGMVSSAQSSSQRVSSAQKEAAHQPVPLRSCRGPAGRGDWYLTPATHVEPQDSSALLYTPCVGWLLLLGEPDHLHFLLFLF